MKNSNDTVGNRTRDLPTCSAVLQPTAPPRDPIIKMVEINFFYMCKTSIICTVLYFVLKFCNGGLIMVFLDRNMQSFLQENRACV